jgi:hypothetical protein
MRNLQVHKELRHFMRPHSTTLCGRCRFLSAPLWDKQSQGGERLPRVSLPAALHIVSRKPNHKKRYGGTYNDYHQLARLLLLVHPG